MKFEQVKDLSELKEGDIIRGKSSGIVFIVTGNYGSHVTAVRTQDVTNPDEWTVLRAENQEQNPIPRQ